jgi:hypothetical protein
MRAIFLSLSMLLTASIASPQLGDVLKGLGGARGGSSDPSQVASGLKEALSVGTTDAVKVTGVENGYFGNQAIKILMPEKLKTLEKGVRMMGGGQQIDDFELSMNRAAESAAPAAAPIFRKAITGMSFSDAKGILSGGNTAATDYFKRTTSADLTSAFRPIVEDAMSKTGVVQKYEGLTKQMQSMPFSKSISFDITGYVVGKSLDGLFYMLGKEEEKIRTNPAAQVTPLLKQVFGKL